MNLDSAAQAEWIEREAYRELLTRVGPSELREQLGLRAEPCGPALVLRSRGLDHVLFNRAFGVDEAGAQAETLAESVVGRFRAQRIERYFIHLRAGDEPTALRARLAALGLTRYPRVWDKFVRGRDAVPAAQQQLAKTLGAARARPGETAALAQLLLTAFELPPSARPLIQHGLLAPRFETYVVRDAGGAPAAGLWLYTQSDLAYLAMAATAPAFRGRGAQTALIAAAVGDALDRGCRLITAETGAAQAGDPNHSHHNLTRAGFRVIHAREHWAPPGTTWASPSAEAHAGQRTTRP